jgi:AhpD family alkylhydroperoxidase
MNNNFHKKVFSAGQLFEDIGYFLVNIPLMFRSFRNKKIDKAFREKIMTITSAVNGCTYCAWFHAGQALSGGISQAEITDMLNLQFNSNASEFETMALMYAQHYAETNRNPQNEMTQKLTDYYGSITSGHILFFIRMISFGNLFGNTWDSVISRIKGKPADSGSLVFEIVFFVSSFWFMIPIMIISKKSRNKNLMLSGSR